MGEGVELCAVVKADGYGHGAGACADAALAGGATRLAVATAVEAQQIGHGLPHVPLLTMGALTPDELDMVLATGSEISVWREGFLGLVADRARAWGRPARVHVKHDSGMGRLGNPRPGGGDRDRPGLRRERRARAGRGLDPFRDRRRTRLAATSTTSSSGSESSPRRSGPSSPR